MQLRDRLRYVAASSRPARVEVEHPLPPGVISGENEYGRVFFKDDFFPLDHLHGQIRLNRVFDADQTLLNRLGTGLTMEHIQKAAYLDIETTGLSGGTGTFAFLVGVGTFDNLSFRLRQYFLMDPGGETAMLAALGETMARCESIVSFNGRSFDIPQLTTRFALSRRSAPFDLPHIDLLHPARRLYSRSLPSCRLAEVERHLLGLRRFGDVSGALIPAIYFSYIRRRNLRGLPPLFEHNSLDVLSLVGFLAYLTSDAGAEIQSNAAHHLALGKWDEARKNPDDAIGQYRRCLALDLHSEVGGQAVLNLARLVRRRDGWRAADAIWQQELGTTTSDVRRIRALVELAKISEHRSRQLNDALKYAEQAVAMIEAASLTGFFALTRPALDLRIQRLQSRLSRSSAAPAR